MLGLNILGIIDIDYNGNKEKILDIPVIGGTSTLSELDPKKVSVNVSIGDNLIRAKYFSIAKAKGFSILLYHQSDSYYFRVCHNQ